MKELIINTRKYREMLLKDPYRPTYHFAPPDDNADPGDPNGAFFVDGIYHLMYLYKNSETEAFHWGHMSSIDLLNWRHHEDALTMHDGDSGCFSGGAFVDDDKTAYITFWKFENYGDAKRTTTGIAMAYSKPPYEKWERIEPIAVPSTNWGVNDVIINGKTVHLGNADPSNIWKMNGYYYMQLGNIEVLNAYGRGENSEPEYQGGWTELYRSKDLHKWEYVHRFYDNTYSYENWPDKTEDDMCPSFLPLYDAKSGGNYTGKYLQLFLAHNRGCQYFVGELDGEKFIPEVHGRMSWVDNCFFAPEALIDNKNRHIMWAWLLGKQSNEFTKHGWSGVYSFPRVLWWQDEQLHMAPAEELDRLQYNHQSFENSLRKIDVKNGEAFRIKAKCAYINCGMIGFKVRENSEGNEFTEVYYDADNKKLVMDATLSGKDGMRRKEDAPFELKEGEKLNLDIFVDKCIVEVYANERQAICRTVYPTNPDDAVNVSVVGNTENIEKLDAWEIFPTNMY